MLRRLSSASLALFLCARAAYSNPAFQNDFQVTDCRGNSSYRLNAAEADPGAPRVAISVLSTTPGLNTGNTYPSRSGPWPRSHSSFASGMVALFRGGSGD